MSIETENEKSLPGNLIINERDYAIRKGRVMEKFSSEFFEKFMHNSLYRQVWESLVRDADPYEIIEKLIEINAEQFQEIKQMVELTQSFQNSWKKT